MFSVSTTNLYAKRKQTASTPVEVVGLIFDDDSRLNAIVAIDPNFGTIDILPTATTQFTFSRNQESFVGAN